MAEELAKDVETLDDFNQLSAVLTKLTGETALKYDVSHDLGYDKNEPEGHHTRNSRNGFSSKKSKAITVKLT